MSIYYPIPTPPIELEILGDRADLLSTGITFITLQRIADKVAHDILDIEGILMPRQRWSTYPSKWFQPEYPRFIQLEIERASTGSFNAAITFALISTLSDPHVVAILENLAANVIWAIGSSKLRGISREITAHIGIPSKLRRKEFDPYQIEPLARDIVIAAEQNPNIKAIRLRSSNVGEVFIDIEFYRRRK